MRFAELRYSACSIDHETTCSSYETFYDRMDHPKGEMNVSVMIVYVHKALEIKQRSTDERYPLIHMICFTFEQKCIV